MTTLVIVPMFAMLGLVTDLGYMRYVKMTAQTAAEAGAQAAILDFHKVLPSGSFSCASNGGPSSVECGDPAGTETNCTALSGTSPVKYGCTYAQNHGFNSTGSWAGWITYQANVSSAPPTAPGIGTPAYWVTYRAYRQVPQLFSAVLGNMTGTVVARSTAAIIGTKDCIYALRPNGAGAVQVGGSASLSAQCGIYDDSSDPCALQSNGSAGSNLSATSYDVVGGYCTSGSLITPTPNTGAAPAPDPLADWPTPASPPYTCNAFPTAPPHTPIHITNSSGVTCFSGGIQIKNNPYTFDPGVYVMLGGGFQLQDTNSTVNGTGVTFYNTFDATHAYDDINIPSGSTVTLTAPTSGNEPGMLFFDDRSAPTGNSCAQGTGANNKSCDDMYLGGSTSLLQGIIYNKNNCVDMGGNSSSQQYQILVANCITIQGTSSINNNYTSLPGGVSPLSKALVVE